MQKQSIGDAVWLDGLSIELDLKNARRRYHSIIESSQLADRPSALRELAADLDDLGDRLRTLATTVDELDRDSAARRAALIQEIKDRARQSGLIMPGDTGDDPPVQ